MEQKIKYNEMDKKIIKGMDLYFKTLLKEKIKNNENIIFSKNNEIITMKAKDFKKTLKKKKSV